MLTEYAIGPAASSARAYAWSIETRLSDGQYMEHSVEHGECRTLEAPEAQEVPSPLPLIRRDMVDISINNLSQPPQNDLARISEVPSLFNIRSPFFSPMDPAFASDMRSPENEEFSFDFSFTPDMSADPQFFNFEDLSSVNPSGREIYNPMSYTSPGLIQSQRTVSKEYIDSVLRSVSQQPRSGLRVDRKFPSPELILDRLESLFDNDRFEESLGDGHTPILRGTSSMSEIHKKIIFSIANNFAGLQDIPAVVILSMLRIDPGISSYLFERIQSNDSSIAKPLAYHLLEAAIERGDETVLGVILETGIVNKITLDQMTCRLEMLSYTPLALAAFLHQYGIVQKLVSFGSSVYVANRKLAMPFIGCALTATISDSRIPAGKVQDLAQDMLEVRLIVELLLEKGAEVGMRHVKDAINFQEDGDLVELLVQAVPREHHCEFFGVDVWNPPSFNPNSVRNRLGQIYFDPQTFRVGPSILGYITQKLENQLAAKIVRNIIATCQTMNCTPACTTKYHQSLDEVFSTAILKNNHELVEYLLGLVQPTPASLTAAIRCRRFDLIELLMKQGNCVSGEPVCSEHMFRLCRQCDSIQTTPLAEAIRSQDSNLLRRLEDHGALKTISGENTLEFQAAAYSTVEVGDLPYLRKLLRRIPTAGKSTFYLPISKAIEMGCNEMATTLIIHQATAPNTENYMGFTYGDKQFSDQFKMALIKRNREILDTLLEYSLSEYEGIENPDIMDDAVRWGEKSVVEDLLRSGYIDIQNCESSLQVAIQTHNTEFAVLLLDWGIYPSGLGTAISVGDEHMMRLLLQYGANPADEDAFSVALRSGNGLLFSAICEAFSLRYPNGIKGFGGGILAEAIEFGDISVLDALLKIKLDVNAEGLDGDKSRARLLRIATTCSKLSDLKKNQMICRLLDAGAYLEAVCRDKFGDSGRTALLQAIIVDELQVVKLLLSKGANINRPARWMLKRTPLQQACEQGSFKMVDLLLGNGADVNASPAANGGATALQLAAIQGSVRIVRLLLDRCADIHAEPAVVHGRTALEGAAEHGRVSVLNILLAEGAAGYSVEEIERAKAYAEKEGHMGCEERLKLARIQFYQRRGSRLLLGS